MGIKVGNQSLGLKDVLPNEERKSIDVPVGAKKKVKKISKKRKEIQVRASVEERALIFANAKKYAGGSISAWVRFASINYHPVPTQKILK